PAPVGERAVRGGDLLTPPGSAGTTARTSRATPTEGPPPIFVIEVGARRRRARGGDASEDSGHHPCAPRLGSPPSRGTRRSRSRPPARPGRLREPALCAGS